MHDTKTKALKILTATLTNANKLEEAADITPDDVPGDTVADVILELAKLYGWEDTDSGSLKTLTLTSAPGTTSGTTKITVTGASDGAVFKYKTGEITTPEYHANLSDWTDWDGTSDITVDDGVRVNVAEVTSDDAAEAFGSVVANSNV